MNHITLQDNTPSLAKRVKKSDAREIESFYQQYYEHYVRALDKGQQADRQASDLLGFIFLLMFIAAYLGCGN